MLSRCLAIVLAPLLAFAPLVLPLGSVHAANAVIAGTLALLLSTLSLTFDRARFGTAILGGWVALTPFIFPSTLLEEVVTVSWGVSMFVLMAGPFSNPPRVSFAAAAAADEPVPAPVSTDGDLPLAA
jgi:hypothetical protein